MSEWFKGYPKYKKHKSYNFENLRLDLVLYLYAFLN